MTVRRAAFLAGLIVAGIVLLAAALATWLLATTSGLRFAWNRAAVLLPDVDVEALDGRLIGPLTIEGLVLTTSGMRIGLERAEIEWQPLALFGRSFNADSIALRGLDVVMIPAQPGAAAANEEPFRLPDSIELPVSVNVESLTLDGARIYAEPGAEPLTVTRASLSAHLGASEWIVHEILVRAPLFDADGRAAVSPRADYPAEAELDWTVRPPELPAASGTTLVTGDLSALRVEQRVAPPYTLDATVTVADPLGQLTLDGRLDLRVEPAALGYELPITSVAASVAVEGPLDDLGLSGRAQAPAPELAELRLDFDGRYTGDAVEFDTLRLGDTGSAAEVVLAGRVALLPQIDVDLQGEWASLQWPLRGEPVASSRSGTLRLTGSPGDLTAALDAALLGGGIEGTLRRAGEEIAADLEWRNLSWPEAEPQLTSDSGNLVLEGRLDDYRLTVDAALALADGTGGFVRLDGAGDLERLDLEQVDVAALDGMMSAQGYVAWAPALAAELELTADQIDPGVIAAGWSGRVGGSLRGAASFADGALDAELERLTLAGELRDRPVELDARGRFEAGDARIEVFALRSGNSSVEARGTIAEQLDFEWRLASPDLADLWPELAGSVDVAGRASGPRLRPTVTLDADGADLDVLGVAVGSFTAAANVDAAGEQESSVDVDVESLRYGENVLERLEVTGSGDAAAHTLSLEAAGEGAEAAMALRGAFERPWEPDFEWGFTLEQASLRYAELEPWSLAAPASGRVTRAGTELAETCLTSGSASLCVEAESEQGATSARFALAELPFQYFASFFPDGSRMTGTLAADGEIALPPGEPPRVDVELATSRGRIGSDVGGGVAGFTFGRGTGRFAWDGERMDVGLDWPFEREQGRLELDAVLVQAPGRPFAASSVEGDLIIELQDLTFVPDLVAGVADTGGTMAGDIRVTGTVAEPRIAGRLELIDGTARLREPGITLEGVRLALLGDGLGGIAVEAEGRSGGGVFEADGRLDLDGSIPVGYVAVSGEDFQLIDTPDATVYVTPDLRLELEPQRLELTGDVVVPRAEITPRGTTSGAIQPSADQVFVDAEEQQAAATDRPLYAQVEIQLGEHVEFEGFGLTGRLAGALEVVEVPREPTTGSGELRVVDGTYVAYGQELEIRTGRLIFAGGALTRPGLDIEAVRRPAEDVLVGARVQGTLRQPELSVFSEPAMARQEQLSYLVLGRPLENASASENSALSQAAMALGLRGGNFVSERVNESLGFDEFGIQTQPGEDANSASFVIGKYLSPSLYVSYGVGLFQPVNTLRLRYTISSKWRLVTESSSEGSGGDLIYHIERD
ncbi:MAG: translocation/assembly module TamB domain-containing protein [Gammaproteobacteria bacterium]|nr:translocation/assembly module TamB domain-containing protein [Gammaproteobacteria bacterium]